MKITGICLSTAVTALAPCYLLAQQSDTSQQVAQAAADNPQSGLEEIVITAQKRTERLQDVPVTASVVSDSELANSNVSDVSDLNKLVPALNINGSVSGRAPMGIRGISSVSNEAAVGVPSGVAIMVDGVPVPPDSDAGNNVEDIRSVEVLEGPQATLGGRTAAAGIINYRTFDPTPTWTGAMDATATTDNEYRASGHISGPVADRLQFSLSGYDAQRYYPITNSFYDRKTGQKNWGLRGKLLWQISDNLSAKLSYHHATSRVDGANFTYVYVTPNSDLLFTPGPLTQSLLLPGITPSWNNLHINSPVQTAGHRHDDNDTQLDLTYQLGDYTLSSTTAYQHEDQSQTQDLFLTAVYFFDTLVTGNPVTSNPQIFNDTQLQTERIKQWSEELKVVSPANRPLSFVAGLFFSDTTVDETYFRALPVAQENLRVIPDTATYDLYGRATWKITPENSLLVGLRYNYDVLKYKYAETVYGLSPTEVFGPYYSTSNSHYCSAGGGTAPSTVTNYSYSSCNSQAVVGDVSFQHRFTDDVMGYATYARGYSPEVYNTAATLTSNAPLMPVGQERINHYEIGAKGAYFNRRLTVNVDAFDTVYNDFQVQQFSVIPGAINPLIGLQAAGKAETRGAEFNSSWRATDNTTLSASTAYVDAKFVRYQGAACEPGTVVITSTGPQVVQPTNCTNDGGNLVQDMSGKPMPNAPKWKFYVDGQQRIPLGGLPFELSLDANWSYRTAAGMLPDNNPNAVMPAFGIFNLSAGLKSTNGNWQVVAFCNNVFNRVYFLDVEDFWSSPWSGTSNVIGQPARDAQRYGGIRASLSF